MTASSQAVNTRNPTIGVKARQVAIFALEPKQLAVILHG